MLDFEGICRVCKNQRENLLNLFVNNSEDEPTLAEKLSVCSSITLKKFDSLPQNICYACAKTLEIAHEFREKCQKADEEFKLLVERENPKNTELPDSTMLFEIVVDEELDDEELLEISNVHQQYETELAAASEDSMEDSERKYPCGQCSKKFFTDEALELHERLHHKTKVKPQSERKTIETKESIYKCNLCKANFDSTATLRKHKTIKHGSMKVLCIVCGNLINKNTYKMHLASHEKDEKFICKVCSKTFADIRYLARHMLYHQSISFQCIEPGCDKDFNVKHKLVQHLRRHHNKNISRSEVKKIVGVSQDCYDDIESLD